MVCRTLRMALLVGAVTAAVVSPARASHKAPCCNDPCGAPACCDSAPCAPTTSCAPAAPQYRTVTINECVPETYTVKRTAYRYECRTEQYDTCRTECVPEVRERVCTYTRRVPVTTTQVRKVCRNVTTYEERTVMKTCYQTVQETCMKKVLVRRGHWEKTEECVPKHNLFRGHHGHGDCCDPCACSCPCQEYRVRTHCHWVNCPEYCERPVTVCRKVCVQVPTTCRVAVCRQVWEDVTVQVCTYQCVTEQRVEKYTVNVTRQVPCKATRTVRVCVPYEETVTCTRMVQRCRTIQVPVSDCGSSACGTACGSAPACCESGCGHSRGGLFRGRGHGHHSSCGCGCN